MNNRHSDSELLRLLQTAGWLWLGYLVALLLIDQLLYQTIRPMLVHTLINGCAAAVFLGLAYWDGLQRWLKNLYLPLMLVLIAGLPLVVNHLMQTGPRIGNLSNPEGMALRQLPVLFVALVITAWQYGSAGVIFFSGCTALVELLMVVLVAPLLVFVAGMPPAPPQRFSPVPFSSVDVFIFLALVRTVSFAVVGVFISQLMGRLRLQQESLADANARLTHYASTLESLTVSRERNRMAHELHDTLAHSLTALSVQLETVKAYWSVDRRKSRQLLDQSLTATRSGLEETRRALKSLRATPLEELGLRLALCQLAESAAARGNLNLELALPELLPSLPPDVEQCLYRIAQEAIENAITHAHAKSLSLSLSQGERIIVLTVRDDGAGFDPVQAEKAGHFGLLGMRERAAMAGGEVNVESSRGKGTTVTLTIGAIP
jgi:signal transduction histidine kinase